MGKETVSGFRDGYITNALLNSPSSIAFYSYNSTAAKIAKYKKAFFKKDTNDTDCLQITQENYKQCTINLINNTESISPQNVVFIDFPPNDILQNATQNVTYGHRLLYIADTGNHCIRSVDLEESILGLKTIKKRW